MVGERETGNERYIVQLVNALAELDVDGQFLVAVSHLREAEEAIAFGPRIRPIEVSSSPIRRLLVDLPSLVKKEGADLLHVTYTGPLWPHCPMVVTIHDVAWRADRSWFSARDALVLSTGTAATANRAARIITPSQHAKSEISRYLGISPDKISVTPEAAAPVFTAITDRAFDGHLFERCVIRRPYILAVGNLQPRKNLSRLIEAFARLVSERQIPHQLVLAGQAKWRESEIHNVIRHLGIEERIVFTGYIPEADLIALLNGASLFVYPSLYEGFGLPVLEAMACGTPVVASNCTSIPEVAGDAALLIDPCCVDAISGAIMRVLESESLQGLLRQKGLARAQMFSWRETARLTWDAYRQADKVR